MRALGGPKTVNSSLKARFRNGFVHGSFWFTGRNSCEKCRLMPAKLTSPVYVVSDNIDTDQIIPAQYLTLVPTIPDEYEKLGSYAMAGLPNDLYPHDFIKPGTMKTDYKIVIAGKNFGCGSSREHAPIALGAAGVDVIVAESYARIFFRNSVATGELYPYEAKERLVDTVKIGDVATID